MSQEPLYRRVMSGEASAAWLPARAGLRAASWLYRGIVAGRNRRYDSDSALTQRLPVPVISVGNITAGGTGKTPMVIELVQRLQRAGRRPAVVSRGYKAGRGVEADELGLVRRHCSEVLTIAAPDRVAGASQAIERGADVIVLDDAFQHRRIHRDLDIVMIDATRPFGYGHVLPRGLLREPLPELRRADVVVVSRADAVAAVEADAICAELRRWNRDAPILRTCHRPTGVLHLDGTAEDASCLVGRRVLCCAGIGNFAAFERSVRQLGAVIRGVCPFPDHARFDQAQFVRLRQRVEKAHGAEWLVMTEKDLVKMDRALWDSFQLPIRALAVRIEFLDRDDTQLDRFLGQLLAGDRSEGADVHRKVQTR